MLAVIGVLWGAAWPAAAAGGQILTVTVTGSDGRPMPGVAVFLTDARRPATYPVTVVDQRTEAFVPTISVITAGEEVQFTNSDPTSHHVYSFSKPNAFALPLYKGDARLATRFMHPGVVVLGCNIHDSMLGYVVIVESTRRGITGTDGVVTLTDVPAGRHTVRAWAPGFNREQPPEVGVVIVDEAAPASAEFRISARGAVSAARQNGSLLDGDY